MEILPMEQYLYVLGVGKKLKLGDNLILAAFGGGFTWGLYI